MLPDRVSNPGPPLICTDCFYYLSILGASGHVIYSGTDIKSGAEEAV